MCISTKLKAKAELFICWVLCTPTSKDFSLLKNWSATSGQFLLMPFLLQLNYPNVTDIWACRWWDRFVHAAAWWAWECAKVLVGNANVITATSPGGDALQMPQAFSTQTEILSTGKVWASPLKQGLSCFRLGSLNQRQLDCPFEILGT